LEPAPDNKPILLKSIKMQVLERFDNGDVLVMHRRRSIREGQGADVTVTARVPAEALARVDNISTLDLADVDWRESFNGDVAERKSANWEDEYSLRLSGFDETKSKDALGLEEKRNQLKSVRDKLENEMKGFAGERSRLSSERAKLLENRAQDSAKISELEKQNAALQKKVDELTPKEEVKLTGDEKNVEAKAGDTGKAAAKAKEPAAKPAQNAQKADAKKEPAKPADDKKKG
jgi:predicted nuclease with TOPRIM domain